MKVMKSGDFVKYMGEEFKAASGVLSELTLQSGDLSDVEKYGFEECEPYNLPNYGRVLCEKTVDLSEVDEYYTIGWKAIYEGYEGGIGRPDKDNNVVIGFGWCHMTPDEAERLEMGVDHGGYYKRVPLDELDIFEVREDFDIQELISVYERAKEKEKNKEND